MNKNRRPFHIIIVMILTLTFLIFGVASVSYAITPWHTVNMEPGTTYDVSKAKKNTTVRINKEGSFYLTGSSKYCRVVIGSKKAVVYLDNITLNPEIYAYVGSRTASISINDQGGTVTLVSTEGSVNNFSSYLGAPAIRKDSPNTKLVFETSNPDNPGTINAKPNSIAGTVGIGCIAGKDNTAGNIVINSGIINATGSKGGAGIGAGAKASVDGITINGGTVNATSANTSEHYQQGNDIIERGAGIGTTHKGTARNITINGGKIKAIGCRQNDQLAGYGEGAGIGGGNYSNAENITINGGDIYAKGGSSQTGDNYSSKPHSGAAGIGGGQGGGALNIVINGGNVEARGGVGAGGIGVGTQANSPLSTSVKITGGNVKASADFDGCGIGSTRTSGSTSVIITGGEITAEGGAINPSNVWAAGGSGIGAGSSEGKGTIAISGGYIKATGTGFHSAIGGMAPDKQGGWYKTDDILVDTISISGGTVEATGGDRSKGAVGGIGYYENRHEIYNPCNMFISGGSIKCGDGTKDGVWGNPKNVKNGIDVFWTKIGLEGCASGKGISKAEFDSLGYTYGLQDVKTLDSGSEPKNGTVWFYLPEDQSITRADAKADSGNDTVYCGDVKAKAAGMLYPATKITLKALEEGDKGSDGTAYIAKGLTELHSVTEPKVAGYTIESYSLEKGSAESLIVNKKTELRAGVSGYTDETGKWMHESVSEGLTFYAVKKPINFKIHFDPNKPAESAEEPTGNVEDINIQYGIPQDLPNSGFSIEGYGFKYWNKSRGDSFIVDKDTACRLTTNQGETVTVYAIWDAQTYKIKYNNDQGNIIEDTPEIKYNQHVKLQSAESLGFSKEGYHFGGWTTEGLGSFYDDEEEICNLCTANDDDTLTGKTLTAVWIPNSTVSVAVTNDGVPVTDLDGKISLTSDSGTKIENLKYNSDSGCYEEKGVPKGRYNISIEGYDTDGCTIDVVETAGGHAVLDYYTVEAETFGVGSDKANVTISKGSSLKAAATEEPQKLEKILDNSKISISTKVTDDDYAFGGYTASGVQPKWQDDNPALQNQEIIIRGQTKILANIRQKQYSIAFAKNADDATGEMDPMEMICGVEKHLKACDFQREGYEFAGWTRTEKWDGITYKDCQKVNDLTTEDGATVKLYAQWNPDPYFIDFDDNGSLGLMLSQKCFRDLESEISPNEYYMPAYHFTGWNTEDMGTGTSYADKARVLNLAHSKDERVTLYAQWEHDKYTIKFKANGGKGKMADQVMYSRCLFPLDLNRFTRSGYKFVGWSVAKNGHGYSYTDGAEVIDLAKPGRSVTLYAQWLKSGDDSSDTGDSSKLILAAILAGAALAAGLTVVFIRRREKYKC